MVVVDLKVVHVVYTMSPGVFAGGVSKMVYELSSAQERYGVDVEVWTIGIGAAESSFDGVVLRRFNGLRLLGVVASRSLSHALRKLAKSMNERLVVHAHCTFHPLNRQVYRALRGTRARLFYSPHGALDPVLFRGAGFRRMKKRLYVALVERRHLSAASGIFALTGKESEQLVGMNIRAPVQVISNGISAYLGPSRDRSTQVAPSLCFIGRINPKKGLRHIIEALAILRRTHPNATLTIAGDREQFRRYVDELDALVQSLGVVASVRWVGFLAETAKTMLLADVDIFLHASDSEGMPMAVLEAMEASVPCVVTPGCYMQAAAQAGAVLEVAQDPVVMAAALVRLTNSCTERTTLGCTGHRHAREFHAWPAIAERYVSCYLS